MTSAEKNEYLMELRAQRKYFDRQIKLAKEMLESNTLWEWEIIGINRRVDELNIKIAHTEKEIESTVALDTRSVKAYQVYGLKQAGYTWLEIIKKLGISRVTAKIYFRKVEKIMNKNARKAELAGA